MTLELVHKSRRVHTIHHPTKPMQFVSNGLNFTPENFKRPDIALGLVFHFFQIDIESLILILEINDLMS